VFRILATAAALFVLLGCSRLEDPSVPIDSIIKLERTDTGTLRGDGVTRTVIMAIVPADVDTTKRNITFKATAGAFVGGDPNMSAVVPADNSGHARVTYIVPASSGPVTVTAKVSDFTASLDLQIQPAYPDSIIGDTSSAVATLNGTTKPLITVLAQRATGKASTGIPIAFAAYQIIGGATKNVGRFSGIDGMKLDGSGKATATFAADSGDVEKAEPVFIRAATFNDAGAPLILEIRLRIE
jgi:hypothetical protein